MYDLYEFPNNCTNNQVDKIYTIFNNRSLFGIFYYTLHDLQGNSYKLSKNRILKTEYVINAHTKLWNEIISEIVS